MDRWERFVSARDTRRIVAALGGIYVALAIGIAISLLSARAPLAEVVGRFALLCVPGTVLLYGGYRIREMGLHPDAVPWIAIWTVGRIGVMSGIVATMEFVSPSGVDNPVFAVPFATALGSFGGFVVGVHDARVKTRERELEETVEQLRTSNERLEQFAYAASHDLQEPLRMVSSYLTLLDRRYADDLDEDAREYIDFAVDGADRMRAMVESLLEYSRVTRGDPLEPTDADAVFEDVCTDLQLRIGETDATITADELPTVLADGDQLAQVFRNLLSNALRYSGSEPPRVHVSAERTDDQWRFAVADEGIGIDPEYHDRIFTVFEQLHAGEERDSDEAGGIGLALCERIVERHGVRVSEANSSSTGSRSESVGGEIWLESDPDEGATFYFTLPAVEDREDRRPDAAARGPARG